MSEHVVLELTGAQLSQEQIIEQHDNLVMRAVLANPLAFSPVRDFSSFDSMSLEDYFEKGADGSTIIVKETVDGVMSSIDKSSINILMRSYVDDTLDDASCEHILRHYIANCLQHQWWVRFFTERLAEQFFYSGDASTHHFFNADHLRVLKEMIEHDSDKLHRSLTIAAYAIRVYNQHWEEGANETHSLKINQTGTDAINAAWANHVRTQPHHPEHWDSTYVPTEKDLPDEDLPSVDGTKMPTNFLIQMIGDWMSASLLRNKTASGWYEKTIGTRFIFSKEQMTVMETLLGYEKSLLQEVVGKNPFATESFGVDSNVTPADIKNVRVVNGKKEGTIIVKVNPVTGVNDVNDPPIINVYIDPVTGLSRTLDIKDDTFDDDTVEKALGLEGQASNTDLSTEALGGSKDTKQKIIDYVCSCLNLMDPTGDNGKRFSDLLSPMTDKQFEQWISYLKDGTVQIDLLVPNMKKNLQIPDIFAAAHKIGCKIFERIWMYDMVTGKEYLSTEEFPILRETVRRQEQMLDEKLSVPNKAMKIDSTTGQVTGDDRAGGFSMPEIQILYSKGLKNILQEFVKVRGGDVHAFSEFERSLEETGECALSQINTNSRARSGAVLSTMMEAIHLDNNI